MDPALAAMSPFEATGVDGMLEDAVDAVTRPCTIGVANGSLGTSSQSRHGAPSVPATPSSTPCSFCALSTTTRSIPVDGLYVCAGCIVGQGRRPRAFPLGTFKCCPTATEAVDGDVVRCAGCHRWYHVHCLGIAEGVLRSYVTLSTTTWYCPEPACCDRVLQRHLRK
ncbi:hypothetical protein NESM_000927400 [Novymonas esmeraldas]|uniref:PHD-type domain-containing protein n=1 Tax=Novymonas esmeraldas TaxID=1808958 RepID=A0AAW0F2N3_9TRYP